MKKIGIITLNGGTNFGNKLQNYGLQAALKDFGYMPETIVNHFTDGVGGMRKKQPKKKNLSYYLEAIRSRLHYRYDLKNSCSSIVTDLVYSAVKKNRIKTSLNERNASFAEFEKNHLHFADKSIKTIDAEGFPIKDYAAFISGSDQIWNPNYSFTSAISFLQFADEKQRIAYAPSFGLGQIPAELREQYTLWLDSFSSLSVRENRGSEMIYELTGKNAPVVLDPTMLLTAERWRKFAKEPKQMYAEKYILTYFLGDMTRAYRKQIKRLAKQRKCKVINLLSIKEQAYSADPQEFLWYIDHADLICTDSYHGTVFSVLLEKPFLVFSRKDNDGNMSSRFQTICDLIGRTDIYYIDGEEYVCSPNYKEVKTRLEEKRAFSLSYLSEALRRAEM